MLGQKHRLSSREFEAAFGRSRSYRHALFTLRLHWRSGSPAATSEASLRAAFVAPKKIGKAAHRNRARRRLREAFRSRFPELVQVLGAHSGAGCDAIFLASAQCETASLQEMGDAVALLWRRAVEEHNGTRPRSGSPRSPSRAEREGSGA